MGVYNSFKVDDTSDDKLSPEAAVSLFGFPAGINASNQAAPSRKPANSLGLVVVDMDNAQPLIEAFHQIKLLQGKGRDGHVKIIVNRVHTEVQGTAVYNKLAALCENILDLRLEYLGSVPGDSGLTAMAELAGDVSAEPENTSISARAPRGRLRYLFDYWSHKASSGK